MTTKFMIILFYIKIEELHIKYTDHTNIKLVLNIIKIMQIS
jgi:hypothetical protein